MFKKKKKKVNLPFSAYTGESPYVFISYAHVDRSIVFPIINELNKRGILMWYDEGIEAGAEWPQFIADRIVNCSKLVLFITPDSIRSHHVRQEINFANSKGKPILPIYLKPTKLNAGIEMVLSVFQAVFSYAYKNDDEGFYSVLVKALTEGFLSEDAEVTLLEEDMEVTLLEEDHNSTQLLMLDEYGDKSLPRVIHLPNSGQFTVGRFDISVGIQQSSFEFSKETRNVSRHPAVFECTVEGYTVMDLGSKAGTWVNGRRIPTNSPQRLEHGYHVSFGNGGANYIFQRS